MNAEASIDGVKSDIRSFEQALRDRMGLSQKEAAAVASLGYPPVTDQIDAIMKMGASLRDAGFCMPPETSKWIDDCLAVKREIPKNSVSEPAQAGFLTPGTDMRNRKRGQS